MSCPIVSAPCGKVQGRVSNVPEVSDAKQSYAYLGIPFAKPPVGDLRFEPPQKNTPWEGVLQATKHPATPAQEIKMAQSTIESYVLGNQYETSLVDFNEDCLYLNVFTSQPDKSADMPVMVWFYGGGFQVGGIDFYDPQVLCSLNDVVVVIPNYRLNAFGFFTLGPKSNYTGNMGLNDQIMALKWVRDNIRDFGGNPENVTIFGGSAGSMSVCCHMVSPLSRGLFHRSINQSGTLHLAAFVKRDYPEVREKILEFLKIIETEPVEIMAKLKGISAEKIIEAQEKTVQGLYGFGLTIDGEIVPHQPRELLQRKAYANVPSMIGCNNTEGSGMFCDQVPGYFDGLTKEFVRAAIKGELASRVEEDKLEKAAQETIDFYSRKFDDSDKMKWSYIFSQVVGDSWFVAPSVEQCDTYSDISEGKTYLYYMTHQMQLHHEKGFGNARMKPDNCEADHTDDIPFTFGAPFYNGKTTFEAKFTEEEKDLSRKWMTYLTNFAKTGNPNNGEKVDVEWPNYDRTTKQHLTFQSPFGIGENLCEESVKFWNGTLPLI